MNFQPTLLSLAVCSLAGAWFATPAVAATETQAAPTEFHGVPCQGKVARFDDGSLKSCTLAREHVIAGVALPAGTEIRFEENGAPASGVLGQAATLNGFVLPARTTVEFRRGTLERFGLSTAAVVRGVSLPAGSVIFFRNPWEPEVRNTWRLWLPEKTVIQGRLCSVTDDGCGHVFYPSGKIRAIKLAGDEVIDGVPCTSSQNPLRMGVRVMSYGLDALAWFHENGHLAQGMVSRDCAIQGRAFKRGDIVRLQPDGALDPTEKTLGAASRGPRPPAR